MALQGKAISSGQQQLEDIEATPTWRLRKNHKVEVEPPVCLAAPRRMELLRGVAWARWALASDVFEKFEKLFAVFPSHDP